MKRNITENLRVRITKTKVTIILSLRKNLSLNSQFGTKIEILAKKGGNTYAFKGT